MPLATLPALFISHGSPMLALDAGTVGAALHRVASNLPKPQAIVRIIVIKQIYRAMSLINGHLYQRA